jgi:hypothetical protein
MDRVEEIEAAIHDLPPAEYRRLAEWFREFEQGRWDAQMDEDSSAGRLDFLFEEAESARNKSVREPRIGAATSEFVVPDSFFETLSGEILDTFRGK